MIYKYMVGVYAVLVKGGKWTISSSDNTNSLPVVPTDYQLLVAEYLAK